MSVSTSIQHQRIPANAVATAACDVDSGVSIYFYGYWFSQGLA
ncbi:hypothetical protein ACBQ16_00545 [Halopseudomonas bauzanensis]|nr:hypothetical protein [Halopseudomonas bauzanensis]